MERVLVIDDEESYRHLLQTVLKSAGYETLTASDARQGLEILSAQDVDVVVTDLQMPGMHGLELVTVLRDMEPRPRIIAISGTGQTQLDMAEMLGADVQLSKPLPPDVLLAVLRGEEVQHPSPDAAGDDG